MNTSFFHPHPALQQWIECYWSWESPGTKAGMELPKILPSTTWEIILYYRSPLSCSDKQKNYGLLPQSHVAGGFISPLQLLSSGPMGFLSVRFRPGAFCHFSSLPLAELTRAFLPLSTVWGIEGKTLEARILEAPTPQRRKEILDEMLLSFLRRHYKGNLSISALLAPGPESTHSLKTMAATAGLSLRQMERLFQQYVGLSPKLYQRIQRFERTLFRLLSFRPTPLLSAALDEGYYDQSHFIKDFRDLAGNTPTQLLLDEKYLSYFYNPATPSSPMLEETHRIELEEKIWKSKAVFFSSPPASFTTQSV